MKRITSIIATSSLLAWAGVASAAVGVHDIDTTAAYPSNPSYDIGRALVGSDTLNAVMDGLIASMQGDSLLSATGYNLYLGLGSSVGERFLIGGETRTGEPSCTPTDANGGVDGNPGCEEIAPMSREMGSTICDDDHDNSAGAGGWSGTNTTAEGMAICKDGIVLVTDNTSLGQYGTDATSCSAYSPTITSNTGNAFPDLGVGSLRSAGTIDIDPPGAGVEDYQIGTGALSGTNAWKDVVRIIYTGCDQGSGTCAGGNNRVARCSSELRTKLLADWGKLFEGTDCGSPGNNCSTGLRKAYRRDDASGTTGAFLEILGVAASTSANLLSRSTVVSGILGDTITAMPSNGAFCDGGHQEGWFPTNVTGGVAKFDLGDPIRKNCRAEDDLCAFDGKMPVVRSIKSTFTPDPLDELSGFPKYQCTKDAFARKLYIDAPALPVCPDGTKPNLAGCKFPYYTNDGGVTKEFDCLNQQFSIPLTVPAGTDGRSYNFVMHQSNGTVRMQAGAGASAMPHVASWRENMAKLNLLPGGFAGFAFAPADYECREVDATRTIGCVVGKTICTLGYAGREAAYSTANTYHEKNEPVKLLGFTPSNANVDSADYGFARNLWVNALHGFENLTDDCLGRGASAAHCADEKAIAMEFYNTTVGSRVGDLCSASGYIPRLAIECKGATESAGCGAPTVQAKSECLPDDPAAAP